MSVHGETSEAVSAEVVMASKHSSRPTLLGTFPLLVFSTATEFLIGPHLAARCTISQPSPAPMSSSTRNLRNFTLSNASSVGRRPFSTGPPSPTLTATTNASQLNLGVGSPETVITRRNLRDSLTAYESVFILLPVSDIFVDPTSPSAARRRLSRLPRLTIGHGCSLGSIRQHHREMFEASPL
jgi:hypothetical protein